MKQACRNAAVLCVALCVCGPATAQKAEQGPVVVQKTIEIPEAHGVAPEHPATVEQFREYLRLSGIGEQWRDGWIAALDANRFRGAPYWPESFWVDVKQAMREKDLAPVVFEVYRYTYSHEALEQVNGLLARGGRPAYLASPVGAAFCRQWAMREDQGKQANGAMTLEIIQTVFAKHQDEIKAARAKYMAQHPDWKD